MAVDLKDSNYLTEGQDQKVKCILKWVNKLVGSLERENRAKFVQSALDSLAESVQARKRRDESLG